MNTRATTPDEHLHAGISPEHFIPQHTFVYVIKGIMQCFDGSKTYTFRGGNGALARKNRLARYKKEKEEGQLEKVFVYFDESFLRSVQKKHSSRIPKFLPADTFIPIDPTDLLAAFIHSLMPYYHGGGSIDPAFTDIKREELLILLLQAQPELSGIFFNFGQPEKINLEEFMNRNYPFNVTLDRLAYLTGRSLSAFKRDFKDIFNETPGRWLIKRRLQEAWFLLDKKNKKPADIFFDLGFATLSHFSFAFKKQFNITPTELVNRRESV